MVTCGPRDQRRARRSGACTMQYWSAIQTAYWLRARYLLRRAAGGVSASPRQVQAETLLRYPSLVNVFYGGPRRDCHDLLKNSSRSTGPLVADIWSSTPPSGFTSPSRSSRLALPSYFSGLLSPLVMFLLTIFPFVAFV